ncbi:MAG: hypothetical protein K6G50_14055 [bacterium]|nr:hypothetical protein [bacterium]
MRDYLRSLADSWHNDAQLQGFCDYFLIYNTDIWLTSLAVLTIFVILAGLREFLAPLRRMPRLHLLGMLAITAASAAVHCIWIYHCPQVYFDEINFLEYGRCLAEKGKYIIERRIAGDLLNPIPPACSFMLSRWFAIFGSSIQTASASAIAVSSLSIGAAFAFAYKLFLKPAPAYFFSLALFALPVHLRMSSCSALENGSLLWLILFMICLIGWADERKNIWIYAAGCCAAWLASWRMENPLVILPLAFAVTWICRPQLGAAFREPAFYITAAAALFLSLPGLVSDLCGVSRGYYLFYNSEEKAAEQIAQNSVNNLVYWIEAKIHPLEFTVLGLLGFLICPRRLGMAWALWFITLNIFYGRIPSADFALHHTIDSWRNALMPSFGLLIGFAACMDAAREYFARKSWRALASVAMCAVIISVPLRFSGFIRAQHMWQSEFLLLQSAGSRMPPGARLMLDGAPDSIMFEDLRTIAASWAAGRPCQAVMIPEESFIEPGTGFSPRLLRDLEIYLGRNERVFLYYFGVGGSTWDICRHNWYNMFFNMHVAASLASRTTRATMTIYEFDSLKPLAYKWLENEEPDP